MAESVTVTVEETERDGERSWYGTLSVTHLTGLTAGESYRMTLDDGRSGEFTVRRNTYAGGADRAVACHGVGPLVAR